MMRLRFAGLVVVVSVAVALTTACGGGAGVGAGQEATYRAKRTPDNTPDLSGIWQANNTANWDIEPHEARMGPVVALAAAFSVPAGLGVVEGEEIPYLPAALEKRNANRADWMKLDPEIKCYLPGIPRATYMPYPFEIVQSKDNVIFTYEFTSASRVVRMNSQEKSPAPSWMGWSIGKWDGESLVIDVTDHMPDTWLDRAGNWHSDALKVTERYTPIDANTLQYEATMEDPGVYAKPWKIKMPLYRRREPNMQLLEYKCVPFAEELLYGHLRKKP
jgi:hypothetical protein